MAQKIKSKKFISLQTRILIIIFPLVFVTALLSAWYAVYTAQKNTLDMAYNTALNEQFRVGYAIKQSAEGQQLQKEDEALYLLGTVRSIAASYSEFYETTASYRIINEKFGTVYSSIPDAYILLINATPNVDGTILYSMRQTDGNTLIIVSSYIKIYQSLFRLDYIQDISDIVTTEAEIAQNIALSLFISQLLLLLALTFYIKRVFAPLEKLNESAIAISKGEYGLRATAPYRDEVGQLAESFNTMAEAVAERIDDLKQTAAQKELFASNLAHEIRTPLTSIVAYADYLSKTDTQGEKMQDILSYIKREGQRLSALSEKTLMWNLITRNNISLTLCMSKRIVNQSIFTVEPLAKEKQQRLIVKNTVSAIYGNEALLISLIVNLLKNAIQASPNESAIQLSVYQENNLTCIQVTDEGIGITETEISHITEPFYMVDRSRDRKKGGSGLGLAIVSAIVDVHDGSMQIQSTVNTGTDIIVKFPQR